MLTLYMDHHVHRDITQSLRERSIDVITAHEDGYDQAPDPELLDRASALGRVLFSQDTDLLIEATRRQRQGIPFGGVIYGHQLHVPLGTCVLHLELIAKTCSAEEVQDQVVYLPL
jgi:hypothetical protein